MNIYTVSFFGHRYIERGTEIENRLDKLLHDLITQKEYVDFPIGRDGDFDLLASAAIKRAIRSYGYGNTHFTLVLPYMKAEYRDNEKKYLDYYDEVEVCAGSSVAHPKSAIQVRNRSMIDKTNIIIDVIKITIFFLLFSFLVLTIADIDRIHMVIVTKIHNIG